MDPKTATLAAYDRYAARFDEEYERHLRRYNLAHADAFAAALRGPAVLDIGSGPGNHAAYFAAKGLQVLCGDAAPGMVLLCRRKGLEADVLDLESFSLPQRFHGIWANACLLHLPKSAVPAALERIAAHLAPEGLLGCAVKRGEGERLEEDPDYPDAARRFSYFGHAEFLGLLARRFDVERFEATVTRSKRTVFLKYLARLRPS